MDVLKYNICILVYGKSNLISYITNATVRDCTKHKSLMYQHTIRYATGRVGT